MGYVAKDLVTGRGKHAGVGNILQGGGSVGSSISFGYMGYDPTHGLVPWDFPEQDGSSSHKKTAAAESGRKLGVPLLGGDY